MSSSVDFWYLLISQRATVLGLFLWGFFTPPSTAAGVLFQAGIPDLPAPTAGFLWEAVFCHSISCCIPLVNAGTRILLLLLWLYIIIKSSMSFWSHPLAITACWRARVNPLFTKTTSSSLLNLCLDFFGVGLPMFPWWKLGSEWSFSIFEFSLHVQGLLLHADQLSDFPVGGPFPKVCLLSWKFVPITYYVHNHTPICTALLTGSLFWHLHRDNMVPVLATFLWILDLWDTSHHHLSKLSGTPDNIHI